MLKPARRARWLKSERSIAASASRTPTAFGVRPERAIDEIERKGVVDVEPRVVQIVKLGVVHGDAAPSRAHGDVDAAVI